MRAFILLALFSLGAVPSAAQLDMRTILEDATQAAVRARDPQARALCMAEVGAAWHGTDRARYEEAIERAISYAEACRTEMTRALALRTVARRILAVDRESSVRLLNDALAASEKLDTPIERAVVLRELAALARDLNADDAAGITSAAADAAREVDEPLLRGSSLRDLAADLVASDEEQARKLFEESYAVLHAPGDAEPGAELAKVELAASWAAIDLDAARRLIGELNGEQVRPLALAAVARALSEQSPERALSLAQDLPSGASRAHVIAAGAAGMSPESAATAEALARSALAMLEGAHGAAADEARTDVAISLARTAPDDAIAVLKMIADEDSRLIALGAVAERIGEKDPGRGIALLRASEEPLFTEPSLAALAVRLARTSPEEALAVSREILSRRLRVEVLVGVARELKKRQEGK